LQENKKIFVACSNKKWLKSFHKHFFETDFNLIENKDGFKNKN
jgi:hypothetical protein